MELITPYLTAYPILTTSLAVIASGLVLSKVLKTKKSFKGKVVIITGASSGIGEQIALQYAAEGAKLVLAARRADRLSNIVEKCKSLGGEAIAVSTDVTVEDECKALIETTLKRFSAIDLLVLNAGQGCLLKLSEVTDFTPFKKVMDLNLFGCIYPTSFALPHLRKSKGSIAVISSLAGKIPTPRRSIYGASKSAVNTFFNCLRMEEPDISITLICPGFIMTEFHTQIYGPEGGVKREVKHFMTAETCAKIVKDSVATSEREVIMTAKGKFGAYLSVFLPSLVDKLAAREAESTVRPNEH